MKEIIRRHLTGERALFEEHDAHIKECIFHDGESPLKHSGNIKIERTLFRWKYPLWYSKDVSLENCTLFEPARAAIWYSDNIKVKNTIIEAPKSFRRCKDIELDNVTFTNALETLWNCGNVAMNNVSASMGDYLLMNSENITINNLNLIGNYAFDGAKNVIVKNSRLVTKDAFWNCEQVTVTDSFITGEYLGWNSKSLTFVNCVIESLQGLCYIDNLVMKNCTLINTTLAFEYSSVNADIVGKIDSVLNPKSGTITADKIDELILDRDKTDPDKISVIIRQHGEF